MGLSCLHLRFPCISENFRNPFQALIAILALSKNSLRFGKCAVGHQVMISRALEPNSGFFKIVVRVSATGL
jgi:hypothetical protein